MIGKALHQLRPSKLWCPPPPYAPAPATPTYSDAGNARPSPIIPRAVSATLSPLLRDQVFRIGHLGNMNELMLAGALSGAEMAMNDSGMSVKLGSGVGKALEYWHQTSRVIKTRESLLQ